MNVYMISYDLNRPGQNYPDLIAELQRSPDWWHHLKSTWLIATNETPAALWERIRSKVDESDRVLIIRVTAPHSGWLTQEAWDWINKYGV